MIEAKASGYMVKETPKEEILKAIDMVMRGEIYCSGEVMTRLVALAQRTSSNPMKPLTKPSFTQRELMVMIENTNELSCKEIAKKLNLDVSSVESAKKRLFEKTNCRNSVGLAIYAIRNFIIRL